MVRQQKTVSMTNAAANGGSDYSGKWSLALPTHTTYTDAIAYILSANREALDELSVNTLEDCSCTLWKLLDETSIGQPHETDLAFPRAPAILWSAFHVGYLANSSFSGNKGFSHILRMDNTMITMQQVYLTRNVVLASVVNVWYGDLWWHVGLMERNRVLHGGSVLATGAIMGHFKMINVAGNTAEPDPACVKETKLVEAVVSTTCLAPIWRLSKLENVTFQDLTFTKNTGSIVIDVDEFYTANTLKNIAVSDNRASGIRMLGTMPSYEGHGVVIDNISVTDNIQGSAQVGGLVLGGFSSYRSTFLPISITNSEFRNNTIGSKDSQLAVGSLQLKGGGLKFTAPIDSPTNIQHGDLTSVSITVSNTVIAGNVAAEGGGIWSAWPFVMKNCTITRNVATLSGGGMYLRGLQQNALAMGPVLVSNSSITSNRATFGGGLACDNCRAVLSADIRNNTAIMNFSNSSISSSLAGPAGFQASSSSSDVDPNDSWMSNTVPGAGGAISVNLASTDSRSNCCNSRGYVLVCGHGRSGNGSSSPVNLSGNRAETVGGAIYANATIPAQCTSPVVQNSIRDKSCLACTEAAAHSTSQLAQGPNVQSGWPSIELCGVTLYDVSTVGCTAAIGGDLVALAQQSSCPVNLWGINTSYGRGAYAGFQVFSCDAHKQSDIGAKVASGGVCEHTYPAEDLANRTHAVFQVPHRLYVFNTACLHQESQKVDAMGHVYNASVCEISVPPTLPDADSCQRKLVHDTIPQVYAGQAMAFTVSLSPSPWDPNLTPQVPKVHTSHSPNFPRKASPDVTAPSLMGLGRITIHQAEDMFVIGNQGSQSGSLNSSGLVSFLDLALQPNVAPIRNREYTFGFGLHDEINLLRQVQHVVFVKVKLLRCTLGQHMTVNRCINCSTWGTYSLHPDMDCLACPFGGNCTYGVLVPRDYFYIHDPLVPQVIACPLKSGCRGQVGEVAVQQLMQQAGLTMQPSAATATTASTTGSKLQLQTAAAQSASSRHTSGGTVSSDGNQPMALLPRSAVLFEFQQALAQTLTLDEESKGQALLLGINYAALLDGWHKLQCAPGYMGNLCASCDPNYTDTSVGITTTLRYGLYLNKCISCNDGAASWGAIVALYIIWCGYLAFGIIMQIRAPRTYQSPFQLQVAAQQSVAPVAPASAGVTAAGSPSPATGGSAATLVAVWKIMTSYVQVIAMVRFLRLSLPHQVNLALFGPDVSSFTSFLSLDCRLPGPASAHAYMRIMLTAVGLPVMLLVTALLAWIAAWGVQKLAAHMQARWGRPPSSATAGVDLTPSLVTAEGAVELGAWASVGTGREPSGHSAFTPADDGQAQKLTSAPSSLQPWRQQLARTSHFMASRFKVPAWLIARLRCMGTTTAPEPLQQYLSLRMLITVVVLCYSCYPLMTSSMLQAIACEPIGNCTELGAALPQDALASPEVAQYLYSQLHRDWAVERANHLLELAGLFKTSNSNRSESRSNGSAQPPSTVAGPYLPRPAMLEAIEVGNRGLVGNGSGLVCGMFWRQDYNVRCLQGGHLWVAIFGAVGLCLLGVLVPLLGGVLLWKNRHRLRDWDFLQKYSFLYSEYRRQFCYWECVIIARKLLFLATMTLLPLAQATNMTSELRDLVIEYWQLEIGVALAILFLVCHEILRPFSSALLNHLERVGLMSAAFTYHLITCALVVNSETRKLALLVVLGVLNMGVICYYLFHIACPLWALVREPVKGWLRVTRHRTKVSWSRRVSWVQRLMVALHAAVHRGANANNTVAP